jgi:hypothetical protein
MHYPSACPKRISALGATSVSEKELGSVKTLWLYKTSESPPSFEECPGQKFI